MALQTLGKSDTHDLFYVDVVFDAANVGANSAADQTVTVTGVVAGVDEVIRVVPPVGITTGLSVQNAHVSADDQVTLRLDNRTGSGIDLASGTWRFVIGRFGRAS